MSELEVCMMILWRIPFCTAFAANGNRSKFEFVLNILKPTATSALAVYNFRDARNQLTICNTCATFLQSCVVPKYSIDNAFDFGLTPLEQQGLIDIEPHCMHFALSHFHVRELPPSRWWPVSIPRSCYLLDILRERRFGHPSLSSEAR
jgi:hypothetical protein